MSTQRPLGQAHRQRFHPLWRIAQDELVHVLLVTLVVVAGTRGVVQLAGEVLEGDTQAFDRRLLQMLRFPEDPEWPCGPRWLVKVGRDVAAFGSSVLVALLTAAVADYLWLQRTYGTLWFVLVATAGGGLLSHLLTVLFAGSVLPRCHAFG